MWSGRATTSCVHLAACAVALRSQPPQQQESAASGPAARHEGEAARSQLQEGELPHQ